MNVHKLVWLNVLLLIVWGSDQETFESNLEILSQKAYSVSTQMEGRDLNITDPQFIAFTDNFYSTLTFFISF
jgi:hypothetical protein